MTDRHPPLARIVRSYVSTIEALLIFGMALVVVLAVLQVFFRYVLGASLSWSEEALRYTMIWVTYLGAGLAYTRGEMIGMDLLMDRLPAIWARIVLLAGRSMIVAMMVVIFWYGAQFAWKTRAAEAVAIPVSMFYIHISVAVGSLLIILHVVVATVISMANETDAR